MSDQYDLAIAKMEIAKFLVTQAFEGRQPGLDADGNMDLLTRLFARAYNSVTEAVEPTLIQMPIPGPDDEARP